MCEVNINNFKAKYPEIKTVLQNAKFIGVDLEFSALHPLKNQSPSLFDSPSERYNKLRKNLENVIPLQIGLTAFSFDANKNSYCGTVFTFYVQPACFQFIQRSFYFQSDSISFLRLYNFDFNKFAYSGIPFINKIQENELISRLKNNDVSEVQNNLKAALEEIERNEGQIVKNWSHKAKIGDHLTIPKICEKHKNDLELLFLIHKNFRRSFKNVWTTIENGEFTVKKLTAEEIAVLEKRNDLEKDLVDSLLGFTKVFRLLTSLRKPIVGHNVLQDILLMIGSFETSLPKSYLEFKKLTVSLFPVIFDTKSISYELKKIVPEEKQWEETGLNTLFEYFKNGSGRHLASNSPEIDIENAENSYGKFHDAGWDSFCAGYVFIRLGHLCIYQKFPSSKSFVSSELIGGLSHLKNRVNVIRGSISSINLGGADPVSTRPPYLVIESVRNKPVDIPQVTSILSSFGFVEIKKFPYHSKRALIAVDNFGNARRILNNFRSNQEFQVKQYNALKHSPIVRAFLLSGVTISGAILLWITHTVVKK